MKNLFFILVFAPSILIVSCKKVDPALVSQMEDTVSAMESQTDQFDMNTQGIVSFAGLVDTAPEALKADTASGFVALQEKVTALRIKQETSVAEYKQVLGELKQASADYSAGKIPTDQARTQYENLNGRLTSIRELLDRVGALNDEAQTDYGKMMAEYRSKTE